MEKTIKHLRFAVVALTVFCGTVPLVVALARHDSASLDRLSDSYLRAFESGASAVFGILKLLPSMDPERLPAGPKKLPKPEAP